MYKNFFGINPNFYINQGINIKDRLLLIFRSLKRSNRLHIMGTEMPAFQFLPTYFALSVNNFAFINISSYFLLSRGMGIPYPSKTLLFPDQQSGFLFEKGSEAISYPLIDIDFDRNCTEIYQPIIFGLNSLFNYRPDLFDKPYIRNIFHLNSLGIGIGKIFFYHNGYLKVYASKKVDLWIPQSQMNFVGWEFLKAIKIQTLEFQNHFIKKEIESNDSRIKERIERQKTLSLTINNITIRRLRSTNKKIN